MGGNILQRRQGKIEPQQLQTCTESFVRFARMHAEGDPDNYGQDGGMFIFLARR